MEVKETNIDDIIKRLIDLYNPNEIFLYGSHAWGEPTKDSDVDLCIVLKKSDKSQADRIRDGLRILQGIRIPIDLLVLTEDEIKERKEHPSTLIFKIINHGKKLYAAA
ncbi:MAG TPA: DNA polymerase III subunit beta [Spirochaeta sp.]|nr:DNA polymerase III subunit beta [Spirochaeta sp.]